MRSAVLCVLVALVLSHAAAAQSGQPFVISGVLAPRVIGARELLDALGPLSREEVRVIGEIHQAYLVAMDELRPSFRAFAEVAPDQFWMNYPPIKTREIRHQRRDLEEELDARMRLMLSRIGEMNENLSLAASRLLADRSFEQGPTYLLGGRGFYLVIVDLRGLLTALQSDQSHEGMGAADAADRAGEMAALCAAYSREMSEVMRGVRTAGARAVDALADALESSGIGEPPYQTEDWDLDDARAALEIWDRVARARVQAGSDAFRANERWMETLAQAMDERSATRLRRAYRAAAIRVFVSQTPSWVMADHQRLASEGRSDLAPEVRAATLELGSAWLERDDRAAKRLIDELLQIAPLDWPYHHRIAAEGSDPIDRVRRIRDDRGQDAERFTAELERLVGPVPAAQDRAEAGSREPDPFRARPTLSMYADTRPRFDAYLLWPIASPADDAWWADVEARIAPASAGEIRAARTEEVDRLRREMGAVMRSSVRADDRSFLPEAAKEKSRARERAYEATREAEERALSLIEAIGTEKVRPLLQSRRLAVEIGEIGGQRAGTSIGRDALVDPVRVIRALLLPPATEDSALSAIAGPLSRLVEARRSRSAAILALWLELGALDERLMWARGEERDQLLQGRRALVGRIDAAAAPSEQACREALKSCSEALEAVLGASSSSWGDYRWTLRLAADASLAPWLPNLNSAVRAWPAARSASPSAREAIALVLARQRPIESEALDVIAALQARLDSADPQSMDAVRLIQDQRRAAAPAHHHAEALLAEIEAILRTDS